jgi:hypothetical protein
VSERKLTLDEFIEKHSAVKVLRDNLRNNLEAMTRLKPKEIDDLMRLHMIMVRQFAQDCGVE